MCVLCVFVLFCVGYVFSFSAVRQSLISETMLYEILFSLWIIIYEVYICKIADVELQWNGIITRTLGEVYILSASWWIHVMLNWCCFGEEYALSYYVNQCCITVCRKLAQYLIRYFSISKAFNIYVLRRNVSLLVAMPVGKIFAWIGCHSNPPAICPRVPARCPITHPLSCYELSTVLCRYIAVSFLQNTHNRHPIAQSWGPDMANILWVQCLINLTFCLGHYSGVCIIVL